ncbi:MAG: SgcJ/EcaC family oxidoreductase [Bacteroidetes bacterium]|jgi:uncharacterized protein (TIGR02246 family)|nr:SgcJ/EcaC family oxidoreductase [Bacteroidota bacterium]
MSTPIRVLSFVLIFIAVLLLTVSTVAAQPVPLTTDADVARAHFEEGRMQMAHVQVERARTHLNAALAADPTFALAHLYRAWASATEEQQTHHLQQAQDHLADVSEGERLMVEAFQASVDGELDRARRLLNTVADQYPQDPHVLYIMVRGKMEQERYADAQATAERALEVDPSFAPAQNQLGYIALQAGDHARAERAFQEYIRLAPDQPNPYDSLGELYVEMGRYDEAIAQLDKALALNPTFPPSITRRAQANIEKANRRLTAAFADQDADAVAAGFTPNGMLLPNDGSMVVGTENIRALYAGAFAGGLDNIELDTREVQVLGDMALEFGRFIVRTGETIVEEGTYAVLWDPSGDTWKIHRDIWNAQAPSDTPASTTTAE